MNPAAARVASHFGVDLTDEELEQSGISKLMSEQEVGDHFADAQVIDASGGPRVNAREAQAIAARQAGFVDPGTAQQLRDMSLVGPETAAALVGNRGIGGQSTGATQTRKPKPSTGGAMGVLRKMGSDAEDVHIAGAERIKEVEELQTQAARSQAAVDIAKMDAQRQVAGRMLDLKADHAKQMAGMEQAREQALQEYRAADAYTSDLAQTTLTPEEYAEARAVIDDPTASDEAKAQKRKKIEDSRGLDKDRVWGGNSFGKVMAHIALAIFGGKLPGLSQVINGIINRDIAEQRAQMEANIRNDKETENFFSTSLKHFGDLEAAKHKSFIAKADVVAQEAEKMLLEVQDPQVRAGLEQQIADIKRQSMEARSKLDERMLELSQRRGLQEVAVRQQIGAQRHQAAMQAQRMQAEAMSALEKGKRLPFGLSGEPVSTKALNDTVGAMSAASGILSTLSRLDQHVEEEGFTQYFTEADAIGGSMSTQLQMEMKDLLELGVLTGPDMEILENIIPSDPGQMRQGRVKAKLKQARTYILDKLKAKVASSGLSLDTEQFAAQHATPGQRAKKETLRDAAALGAVAY